MPTAMMRSPADCYCLRIGVCVFGGKNMATVENDHRRRRLGTSKGVRRPNHCGYEREIRAPHARNVETYIGTLDPKAHMLLWMGFG